MLEFMIIGPLKNSSWCPFAIRYLSFTDLLDFCHNLSIYLEVETPLGCCGHNAAWWPSNPYKLHSPIYKVSLHPMGWVQSVGTCQYVRQFRWTLGPKPLGSQKQIPALTLIETCGVRFADAFLRADFAARFACKLDPDILSWQKKKGRWDCLCGWIYFQWWQTEPGWEKEWGLFQWVRNASWSPQRSSRMFLCSCFKLPRHPSFLESWVPQWPEYFIWQFPGSSLAQLVFYVTRASNALFLQPSRVIRNF